MCVVVSLNTICSFTHCIRSGETGSLMARQAQSLISGGNCRHAEHLCWHFGQQTRLNHHFPTCRRDAASRTTSQSQAQFARALNLH